MTINKHDRTGYVRGCRCDICRSANSEYQRLYMKEWRRKRSEKPITNS